MTPRRNFRIDDNTWNQFIEIAKQNNTTGSKLIRNFINNYIRSSLYSTSKDGSEEVKH